MPPWVCIRGVYPGSMPPCVPWWVYTPRYALPTHPGYTILPTYHWVHRHPCSQTQLKVAWAQSWDIPWVRASLAAQDPKVVRESVSFCAELLRSSRVKSVNDRIATGSFPVFPLWLEASAQGPALPSRHPIVDKCVEETPPVHHPFHCWSRKSRPWAHSRGCRTVVDEE